MARVDLYNPRAPTTTVGIYTDKLWELERSKPECHDAMGSDGSISRKPTADDWEAHREKIRRLYIDDGLSLLDIQNVLRQTHDLSAT